MKKIFFIVIICAASLARQGYEIPPTSSGYGYAPTISDEQMELCVEHYNQAKRIQDELSMTSVNRYSQYEVDSYNSKVREADMLIDWFNENCAGKQSSSACEAAKKLNKEAGLPYQDCY